MKKEETFHFFHEKWCTSDFHPSDEICETKNLRFATYNVLCSNLWIERKISSDTERFKYQLENLLPNLNIDILGLNEISKEYIDLLMKTEWAKKYYLFNPNRDIFKERNGNLILSKFNIKCYSIDEIIKGRIVVVLIKFDKNRSFLVVSAHLSGYEENFKQRKNELQKIIDFIKSYNDSSDFDLKCFKEAVEQNNIIIMGDLNFHNDLEDKVIEKYGFVDLWTETRRDDWGFTWDTLTNPLINIRLPFDNRRMRLDRILLKEDSLLFEIDKKEKMEIFGKEKIYTHKTWSFLMPSDHFGLHVKLALKTNQMKSALSNKIITKTDYPNLKVKPKYRGWKKIVFYRVIASVFIAYVIFMLVKILMGFMFFDEIKFPIKQLLN